MDIQGKQHRLSDGRLLGYAEYGDLNGSPEFYFPGFPASRLEGRIMEPVAKKLSVRIIAVDRPGLGISTGKPGRTLLDWPDDVNELANALGLTRFSVMGHSGGGPYAAACAYRIPHRLTGAGMVGSIAPVDAPGTRSGLLRVARLAYLLSRKSDRVFDIPYAVTAKCVGRHAARIVPLLDRFGPVPDKTLLAQPRLRQMLIDSHCEAVRLGHEGVVQDICIFTRPWGFRLEDIRIPVHVWHGELDTVVSPHDGRYLARTIPRCHAQFHADEGHVSVPINRMEDILGAMAR